MPRKPASQKSSPETRDVDVVNEDGTISYASALQARIRNLDDNLGRLEAEATDPVSPATFSELLKIASDAGVIEFTAGPFSVKFSNAVAEHWRLMNRVAVDGKGRPV